MNSRLLLLSVAVFVTGLYVIPSTLSLFSGQHTFYNGSTVNCQKCHQDIYDEMSGGVSTAHTSLTSCQGCHKTGSLTEVPYNGTSNTSYETNVTTNPNAHAAVTLECVACHSGVPNELLGSDAAHTKFYLNSSYTTNTSAGLNQVNQTVISLKGANTACVGCHTHIIINITWVRAKGYNMIVNESTGSYNITFQTNQTSNNIDTTYSAGQ